MIQFVRAVRVKLDGDHVTNKNGDIGRVWDASRVDDLVVFPETRQARCVIAGRVEVAVYSGYTPEPSSQRAWEGLTSFVCDECGRPFENAQGLGNHMATKHGVKAIRGGK